MNNQAVNPYLPSWEYIPDVEPYVFGERVYVYGSHDYFNGHVFCQGDYAGWSAPVDQLWNWQYEGIIYQKTQDPLNQEGKMCLYAPDVTIGCDGRYYLYYVLDKVPIISVAVADRPQGPFEFYGYVRDEKGRRIGERPGDEPQFDPAVLTEGETTYLYTGFCAPEDTSRHGAMAMVLAPDMLTITSEPVFVLPNKAYGAGSGFEGHEFFEAPSIRKKGKYYYLIYSSVVMHELCYAISLDPLKGFTYGGVVISNCDIGITTDKPADCPMAYGANNHGSIVQILENWYIFYHRHTNNSWYSRQGCAEKISFEEEKIMQAELSSCGLNNGPLAGEGEYPSYIACHMYTDKEQTYVGGSENPYIMQEGRDGEKDPSYITGIRNTATIGFRYFLCQDVQRIGIRTRGYAKGIFEIRTSRNSEVYGVIPIEFSNVWEYYEADIQIPDGVNGLYLTFVGEGCADLWSVTLINRTSNQVK